MLSFIRNTLYNLKKDFGVSIDLYQIGTVTNNLTTGRATETRTRYHIAKAIVLPQSYLTSKIYSLSYIAANKNFTYGAFFNVDNKVLLLDKRDISVEVKPEDYIIFDHKRFEIKAIEKLEYNAGYILILKRLDGAVNSEVHVLNVFQKLRLAQSAENQP